MYLLSLLFFLLLLLLLLLSFLLSLLWKEEMFLQSETFHYFVSATYEEWKQTKWQKRSLFLINSRRVSYQSNE